MTKTVRRDFKIERRLIIFGLVLLVAADIALAVYGWNLSAGQHPQDELAILTRNRDLLRADITRAQDIRKKMPAIKDDCDKFEQSLYSSGKGYSSVSAELDSIAGKAGLSLESTGFRQSEIKGRDMQQVEIDAVVDWQLFASGAFPERFAAGAKCVRSGSVGREGGRCAGRKRQSARADAH